MVTICQKCGHHGDHKELLFCINCRLAAEHRYCLDKMPKHKEQLHWTCYDCTPEEDRMPPPVIPSRKSERISLNKQVKLSRIGMHKHKMGELTDYCSLPEASPSRGNVPLLNKDTKPQNANNQGSKDQQDTGRRRKLILPDEESFDEQYGSGKGEVQDQPSGNRISGNNELGLEKRMLVKGGKDYGESKLFGKELICKGGQLHDAPVSTEVEAGPLNRSCHPPVLKAVVDVPAHPGRAKDPIWRGHLNVKNANRDTIFEVCMYLSTNASPSVHDATDALPPLSLTVEKTSRLPYAWPERFKRSPPTSECIGIYVLPLMDRDERVFNVLLQEMIDCDLALKAMTKDVELLIFSSQLLPSGSRRESQKYFWWGICEKLRTASS